ncbi:HXXEE domain-containing protein [Geodermatophilus sp. SYSU D00815]
MSALAPTGAARLPRAVTWGLFAAWALHDAEELGTMAGWAERARPRLEQDLPWVPPTVWNRMSVSQEHATAAIGVMACVIGAAAARGARTNGRSPFFQAVLAGFGLHAVPHVASAVVTRGYTPGVVTAPTVVAPFALWAWRRLHRAEVPIAPVPPAAPLLGPLVVAGAHVAAAGLLRARARWRRRG